MARKAKSPDPLSEIASRMVATLEAHRSLQSTETETQFLTWNQLIAGQPGVSAEWAEAALKKAPAKARVITAVPGDAESPVALAEDGEQLAGSGAVLQRLVNHSVFGCSESRPVRPLSDLVKSLHKTLKKAAESRWSEHPGKLPAGLSAAQGKGGKLVLHDQRYPRPEVTLARNLISSLEKFRDDGEEHYPADVEQFLSHLGIKQNDPLLKLAMAEPIVADAVGILRGSLKKGWLVLKADTEKLVRSEGLMKRLLKLCCTETSPEVKLSAIAKQLNRDYQTRLIEVWRTHLDLQRKFSFADLYPGGTKAKPDVLLWDLRFPRPEKRLSEKLVSVLEEHKSKNDGSYPLQWKQLIELADGQARGPLIQKAIMIDPFVSRVIMSLPGVPEAPLVLNTDSLLLAESRQLLELLVTRSVTTENQAVTAEKLAAAKGLHPLLKTHVSDAIERFLSAKKLPAGFGALKVGSKWLIFRLQDMVTEEKSDERSRTDVAASRTEASAKGSTTSGVRTKESKQKAEVSADRTQFQSDFDSAFERLSEKSRLPGCVSLADLRPVLSDYAREVVDDGLIALRRSGRYSLSVVEGRYPLTDAERDACLVIDNVPHLLVRRRTS